MKYITWLFSISGCLAACRTAPDLQKEEAEIRRLLRQERTAHFNRDTALFISEFADSMISVNRGVVSAPTRDEHRRRIGKYFSTVRFLMWDDIAEPFIRFSSDATMAYAVIQKKLILSRQGDDGLTVTDTSEYAWVSIYRKYNGEWKVECNTSTNK